MLFELDNYVILKEQKENMPVKIHLLIQNINLNS